MKSGFLYVNVVESLGVTPIASITDELIWELAVTPQVKAVLGDIGPGRIVTRDTIKGDFAGDEVSNVNGHRIYEGGEHVRFPYINSFYRTTSGVFVVKRDGVKIEAFGWFGNPDRGPMELIFQFGLRDRRFDGTKRANDSALVHYPYDDAEHNARSPLDLTSLETSLYSFFPGSRIATTCGDIELEEFVRSPYSFLSRPRKFMRNFNKMWKLGRFPGQIGATFPDVGKLGHRAFDGLALAAGYDMLETCPSHLHVLRWNLNDGYRIVSEKHRQVIAELEDGLKKLKDMGINLTRSQESWACVIQSLRPLSLIPPQLYLGGAVWPQDNVGPENLWLVKPLSEKAKRLISS